MPPEVLPDEPTVPLLPPLPPPVKLSEWLAKPMPKRPEIVHGLLRRGDKMTLGGSSKSKKTWMASHLALCVATGRPWMGFKTTKTPVAFFNLELPEDAFHDRLTQLTSALRIPAGEADVTIWNLRGQLATLRRIDDALKAYQDPIGLLVLDPLYKLLGDRVENAAEDMAELMNHLEAIATRHQCALVIPAHYSKGNQSEKESIDRISGSGVFARDADAIVTMTAHEQADCYTVESVLRSFAPVNPFVARWDYPLFTQEHDLDPAKLKKPGRKPKASREDLLALLPPEGLTWTAWKDAAVDQLGISPTTAKDRIAELRGAGKARQSGPEERYFRNPR